jgi:hypothetical protein
MSGVLASLLKEASETLERCRRQFALVGGMAISVRLEPRFTRDVDLVVAVSGDRDAESLMRNLLAAGYSAVMVIEQESKGRIATVRCKRTTELEHGAFVDLLFASSGIEEEIVAGAEILEIFPQVSLPVASIGHLIALKVLARDDDERPQDLVDLKSLLRVATAEDVEVAESALRLIEDRGFHRGRPLVELLREMAPR